MSEERQDPAQVAAFRAFARRIMDAQSEQKFEDALKRLMTPAPVPEAPRPRGAEEPSRPDASPPKV